MPSLDKFDTVPVVIPTRWLVVSMIVAVAAVGVLAWWDEGRRSEQGLAQLGDEQLATARLAVDLVGAGAGSAQLAALDQPGVRVVRIQRQAGAARVERLSREEAAAIGLPERTAMAGIAPMAAGRGEIAVIATAEAQRDRDRAGLRHWLIAIALAGGLVAAFGGLALARQRTQLGLAHDLAVADAARTRDAELERLSRAATMAALGSGVAHELSTPLGVIVGRAEQLLARGDGDPRVAKNAQAILDQADHIDRVVRGLLELARGAPIAMRAVAPRELVAEAAALVEHRFARAGVALLPAVRAELPEIRCEPLLFKHALVNLLLNACDASPAGRTVRVEVEADAVEVAFAVHDDGEGITAEAAARAIEPFFTTKPAGKGTGLGLAIANEIARAHRGTLAIAARAPRGTLAVITVPLETAT